MTSTRTYAAGVPDMPSEAPTKAPRTHRFKDRRRSRLRYYALTMFWIGLTAGLVVAVMWLNGLVEFDFERYFGEQREELFDRDGEPVEADQWRYFGPANGDD